MKRTSAAVTGSLALALGALLVTPASATAPTPAPTTAPTGGRTGAHVAVPAAVHRAAPGKGSWTAEPVLPGADNTYSLARIDANTTWMGGSQLTFAGPRQPVANSAIYERKGDSGSWSQIATPFYGGRPNAIGASPAGDAWIVGDAPDGQPDGIVTAHRDAAGWKVVKAPVAPDTTTAGFLGVAALARDDAWAVGWDNDGVDDFTGLVEHWNGRAWTPAPVRGISTAQWSLGAVAASGADDVWAVGSTYSTDDENPVVVHYDGRSWRKAAAPVLDGMSGTLTAVTAGPHGQFWAVGREYPADGGELPLLVHYDGHRWSRVSVPLATGELNGVAVAGTRVAVVGDADGASTGAEFADGRWTALSLPAQNGADWSMVRGDLYNADGSLTVTGISQPGGEDEWGNPLPGVVTPLTRR